MAFTYDVTTDRGKVRLRVGDIDSGDSIFSDAEIDYFLDVGGTVVKAAVIGLQTLLVDRARRTKFCSQRGVSQDDRHQLAAIKDAIKSLQATEGIYPTVSSVLPALIPSDGGFQEPTT